MKKRLYIEPCAGLGNRLHALSSAMYYAEKMGLELIIVWKREKACNIHFNKVFNRNTNAKIREIYQMGWKRNPILEWGSNIYLKVVRSGCVFFEPGAIAEQYARGGEQSIEKILCDGDVYIKGYSFFSDNKNSDRYLSEDMFTDEVLKRVDRIIPTRNEVIGVHIRRTDSPSISENPTKAYCDKMDRIIDVTSNVKFYLATDDLDEELYLRERYGEKIVSYNRKLNEKSRTKEAGIEDALTDLICLSRCKCIIGPKPASSFSYAASIIGKNELAYATE